MPFNHLLIWLGLSIARSVALYANNSSSPAVQQLDPIKNMCMRLYHQTVIKNNILYIDGGLETFINVVNGSQQGNVTNGYNEYLIAIDMGQPWDWYTNISEIAYNKSSNPNPNTDTDPPQIINGALYQGPVDDTRLYLYGGTTSYWNTSFAGWQVPTSQQYVLWSYDTNSTKWDQYDISAASVWRPSNGFRAEAPEQGLAFYLNGEIDSGSSQTTQVLGNYIKIFLEGMIVLNATAQTATNISTKDFSGDFPRTRGGMVYIPGIGEHGILVAIGGTYKAVSELDANDGANFVSMSDVFVFDIGAYYGSVNGSNSTASGWYAQNVTGDIPQPRAEFCVIAISPPDGSSHSIYLSAGQGPSNTFYDDVYVLSLPSFTWTQVYGPGQSPHYGHTCHVVGTQLISVGGALATGWGPPCDWHIKGVGVLDLSKIIWGSKYSPDLTNYTVPDKVLATIGGVNGTAAMTQPLGGFGDPGLARLFGFDESPTNEKSSKRNVGAIAGGSTAGGVIAVILIGTVIYLVRSSKRGAEIPNVNIPTDDIHDSNERSQ